MDSNNRLIRARHDNALRYNAGEYASNYSRARPCKTAPEPIDRYCKTHLNLSLNERSIFAAQSLQRQAGQASRPPLNITHKWIFISTNNRVFMGFKAVYARIIAGLAQWQYGSSRSIIPHSKAILSNERAPIIVP
jgi:hypothetical protein